MRCLTKNELAFFCISEPYAYVMASIQCPICTETVTNPVYSRSRHVACKSCIDMWYQKSVDAGLRPLSPNTRAEMDATYYGPLYVTETETVKQTNFLGKGHIVAILDVSGSMGTASKDSVEASPSRISMMIHMVKMLAHVFNNEGYYLSIMQFGSSCSPVISKAESVPNHLIESLRAGGGTDMVTALTTAVSLHGLEPTYIMFTDGEPDPGTEAMTIRAAKNFGDQLKLHVVGFGPRLNDGVMRSLSAAGHGTYTYIFDINTSSVMMSSLVAYLITPPVALAPEDYITHGAFVKKLHDICQEPTSSSSAELLSLLSKFPQTPYCKSLQDDVKHKDEDLGQIDKALKSYATWGKYYLSAIQRAHDLRYPMSDLEKSLQHYASSDFNRVRTESMTSLKDMTFKPVTQTDVTNVAAVRQTIITSTGSADTRGGCFSGEAEIRTKYATKKIKDLRKGDLLFSVDRYGREMIGIVDCIVAYRIDVPLPLYDGFITAYHPIYIENKWCFPYDTLPQSGNAEDYVYNIMLQPGACGVYVDNYLCITIGHDITEDPVARHPYFGTTRVRDEIMDQPGYCMGIVETDFSQSKRKGKLNLVYSMFETPHSPHCKVCAPSEYRLCRV